MTGRTPPTFPTIERSERDSPRDRPYNAGSRADGLPGYRSEVVRSMDGRRGSHLGGERQRRLRSRSDRRRRTAASSSCVRTLPR